MRRRAFLRAMDVSEARRRLLERMNSPLEHRKVRLRGLGAWVRAASRAPVRPQPGVILTRSPLHPFTPSPRRLPRSAPCAITRAPLTALQLAPMIQLLTRTEAQSAAAAPPSFPLRVGGIDVGSNAIRFLAAEFTARTEYRVLTESREPVRLGHEVFLSGQLARGAMEAAVEAIGGFRVQMEALGIGHYRAVATSATRESRNGDEFVARVRRETGIELEVITGSEEARLVYEAVKSQVPFGRKKWLLVDLGGEIGRASG